MDTQTLIPILNKSQFKGIIFDFDETLYNLKIDWDALKKSLEESMTKQFNIKISFTPYIKALSDIKNKNTEAYNYAVNIIKNAEIQGLKEGKPNNLLLDFIYQENSKKFGIYSMNTTNTIIQFLEEYKLQNKFSEIATQQTCIEPKPSGKDLLHMMDSWRYNSNEVLYIGNSSYDKKSGEMAGIRTEIIDMHYGRTYDEIRKNF